MEVFGLAVIVVLITVGFFIFVSLRSHEKVPDIKRDYITDETAANFINSIVNVDVKECYDNGYTVSKLIKSCATQEQITCSGREPCSLANDTIYIIVNKTLIRENYRFNLYTQGLRWNGDKEIIFKRGCGPDDIKGMSGSFAISLYPSLPGQHVYLTLELCK